MQRRKHILSGTSFLLLIALCIVSSAAIHQNVSAASASDWLTYQNNSQASGFNAGETTLTRANVSHLRLHWSHSSSTVTAQPVVSNGVVYWGSWDGIEHAFTVSGTRVWETQLGVTNDSHCNPAHIGIASTASVGNIGKTPVIFVGGGGNANADGHDQVVALNATTGAVIWKTDIGTSPAPASYQFGSPNFFNGSVYIGISSLCDRPLVQGQLVKVDAATGKIQATFNVVPAGCIGGGIWSTPAITSDGHVYVSTGNPGRCSSGESLAFSIVELNASNLSVVGHWRAAVPSGDFDFAGVTTFSAGATQFVGAINKDGIFYALRQNNLPAGPAWQTRVGKQSEGPQSQGNIAPGAFDGTRLYVGAGTRGACPKGNVTALNPATGALIWRHCLSGPVLGAVTAFSGVVVVGAGHVTSVLNSSTGATLFTFTASSNFWGPPSIAEGMIFEGNLNGSLFALGL